MQQSAEIDKYQQRVQSLAEQNLKRTACFLDARNRTIGIDKASLDKQIEEKRQQQALEKKQEQIEANANQALVQYLDYAARKTKEAQQFQIDQVNATLHQQLSAPKNNAMLRGDPIDVNHCGTAWLQRFSGEDCEFSARKKRQQEQERNWYARQIAERDIIEKAQEEPNAQYVQLVQRQEEIRNQIEDEFLSIREKRTKEVHAENMKKAQEVRVKKLDEDLHRNIPILDDSTNSVQRFSGRVTTDQFRGFGKDQIQQIYENNLLIASEKLSRKREEAEEEFKRTSNERNLLLELDQIEKLKEKKRREGNIAQAASWDQQRDELKTKQKRMYEERFGTITEGFFQRFGTSCR